MYLKKRTRFGRFWLRLKVAFKLAFKEKHGICIYINENQLIELLSKDEIKTDMRLSYFGIMEHQAFQIIKQIAETTDEIELICSKAEFEAEVQTRINNKKK